MWPLTQKRRLRRLRASQRIQICVSAWVRQVAKPFSSVSTGPWWRVCTISFTPNWLSGDVPVRNRSGDGGQHPLRGDPFRDFAPFATHALGLKPSCALAMPLPELQHRLNNLTSLDRVLRAASMPAHIRSAATFGSAPQAREPRPVL